MTSQKRPKRNMPALLATIAANQERIKAAEALLRDWREWETRGDTDPEIFNRTVAFLREADHG